jgi:hypothetical protein
VEWSPSDSTVFAAAGEDDQLTIWDLAMEPDTASTEQEVSGEMGEEQEEDIVYR